MRPRISILDLGHSTEESMDRFMSNLNATIDENTWDLIVAPFDYEECTQTEVLAETDLLILSPGTAKLGRPDTTEDTPSLRLYNLIQNMVIQGIPILGINAGHQAIANAYNWNIRRLTQAELPGYQKERNIDLPGELFEFDPESRIMVNPKNNWVVDKNPLSAPGQGIYQPLVQDPRGGVAIAKVTGYKPVYGIQYNPSEGTRSFFQSFFRTTRERL